MVFSGDSRQLQGVLLMKLEAGTTVARMQPVRLLPWLKVPILKSESFEVKQQSDLPKILGNLPILCPAQASIPGTSHGSLLTKSDDQDQKQQGL